VYCTGHGLSRYINYVAFISILFLIFRYVAYRRKVVLRLY